MITDTDEATIAANMVNGSDNECLRDSALSETPKHQVLANSMHGNPKPCSRTAPLSVNFRMKNRGSLWRARSRIPTPHHLLALL